MTAATEPAATEPAAAAPHTYAEAILDTVDPATPYALPLALRLLRHSLLHWIERSGFRRPELFFRSSARSGRGLAIRVVRLDTEIPWFEHAQVPLFEMPWAHIHELSREPDVTVLLSTIFLRLREHLLAHGFSFLAAR